MSTTRRTQLSAIFNLAWQFVKRNGFSLSEALKIAWSNLKLNTKMQTSIVKFYFKKVDGSIREAYGTLNAKLMPTQEAKEERSNRKQNDTVQTYFDTEAQSFRCYKKANLITTL